MRRAHEKIIEHQTSDTLFVRVVVGDRVGRAEETISSIPSIVDDAQRAGLSKIVLDVTGVDHTATYALLPTVVLTCRQAHARGISIRVLAGEHLQASASVAGLTKALSISAA